MLLIFGGNNSLRVPLGCSQEQVSLVTILQNFELHANSTGHKVWRAVLTCSQEQVAYDFSVQPAGSDPENFGNMQVRKSTVRQ
jgi:hypothetical protein